MLQVLGDGEITDLTKSYRSKYGNVLWDESDYLVVVLAGFIATLLDVFLVRIPADTSFLGRLQTGSPPDEVDEGEFQARTRASPEPP